MLNPEEELKKNISRLSAKDPTIINIAVFSPVSQENLVELFHALKGNTTLLELDLNFATVTEKSISVLLRILGSTKLKILKLQSNYFFGNDEDAECPVNDFSAHSLSQSTNLRYLDVSYSKELTDEGVKALANMPLETLYIRECPNVTSKALSFFFNHEYLLDLKFGTSERGASDADKIKIENMKKRNVLIYRMNVLINRVLDSHRSCIESLPLPLQITARQYLQKQYGSHVDTRTLLFNLSKPKLAQCHKHDDFIAALEWLEEYKKLPELEKPDDIGQVLLAPDLSGLSNHSAFFVDAPESPELLKRPRSPSPEI